MNKTLLMGLGALVIIAGGVFFFTSKSAEAPSDSLNDESVATNDMKVLPETMDDGTVVDDGTLAGTGDFDALVSFTGAAFNPATVTIKNGQTVRFINNGNTNVWPASAVHPTHAVYPEKTSLDCLGSAFDACKGLKPGESWDFTFTSVGTWGYHDHLDVKFRGSITVTQ